MTSFEDTQELASAFLIAHACSMIDKGNSWRSDDRRDALLVPKPELGNSYSHCRNMRCPGTWIPCKSLTAERPGLAQ